VNINNRLEPIQDLFMHGKKYLKWLSITIVSLFVSVWALLFFLPKPPLLEGISFSRAVYADDQHLLRLTLSGDDKYRLFIPLSQISPELVAATLLQEDQYFYWHAGVNPLAMLRAVWQTYLIKSRRVGASTITMQIARIRYNIPSKTFLGKIEQIIRALQLETHYSKKQLLEAYLNLAPYGNNIEGVGAASLIYFAKPVKNLTLPEALTLAVIPQNPIRRTPNQKNLKTIRNKLFYRWVALYPKDHAKKAFIDLPLQMLNLHNLPFLAPHFVNTVLKETPITERNITTTLNIQLQHTFENVTHRYLSRKKSLGVYNAAVLLVDTRNMSIKALVGSADFFNQAMGGQINGTDIKRSPGSTLKPFIYGLALDQGLIHPDTVLKDVPRSFGSYNPENFDYDFMGPLHARDALILSRNIPAIYLADQLARPNLYEFLQAAHITNLKSESYYGLALVLGGAELTMQELTGLYAMLVNEGVWHPLRFTLNQSYQIRQRLLSPEASFLILDMLTHTSRPEGSENNLTVSWKTGTSSGYRDAWSIGTFGPYVLSVWIGNFDNTGNPAFVGKNIAAPLFFELLNAIGSAPVVVKNPGELNLAKIAVCKASGMLPTRNCRDTELTWFIPGKSPIKTDTIFREIAIDKKTGLRTCHVNQDTEFKIYEFWSSDLLKIFREAGIQRRTPPLFDPTCSMVRDSGLSPQITSPQTELSYVMRANAANKSLVPLIAIADADVVTLYWFVNDKYLGKTPRDQTYWWAAKSGKFVVRVLDDHGRSDARDVNIQLDS
jgi:penicillin-binding protein 1C